MIVLLLLRSNKLQLGHLECLDEAARYERRGTTVTFILCWWCASLDYEKEVGNEACTSALLLESFDKSASESKGGIQGLGDVRNTHSLRLGLKLLV